MSDQLDSKDDGEISLVDLAATLWKGRVLVVFVTAVAAVASVIYALLQPNVFTAKATVIPIAAEESSSLAQYSGLAQMAGISLPGGSKGSPTQKIEAILKSRSLAERLIAELSLDEKLHRKPPKLEPPRTLEGATLEIFREKTYSATIDEKSGLISVSAETHDPELSRDIANAAVRILEESLNAKAMTVSKKTRRILEAQIADQERKVKALQQELTDYQRKTRIITPQGQVEQAMGLYSALIQQKISAEIELSRLESALSGDNPKITALRTQLEAIERQISSIQGSTSGGSGISLGDTPEALIRYQNILQELEIATKIYGGLLASLENQKLQENEDQLYVEVIDPAVAPELKSGPSRAMICVVGMMAGGFLSVLMLFLLQAVKSLLADPSVRAKFARS